MIKIDDLIPLLKPGFVAYDCCGWCWYACQPRFSNGCWQRICNIVCLSDCFDVEPFDGDWKDSLIEIKAKEGISDPTDIKDEK